MVYMSYAVMHTIWRSRDALKAAFMNMYALTELQKRIANELNVEIGKYVDISNSYHIYERDYETMKKIIKTFYKRSWNERTLTTEKLKKYIT
jgi:thymidylate synthase